VDSGSTDARVPTRECLVERAHVRETKKRVIQVRISMLMLIDTKMPSSTSEEVA
jgi:hypothetical protein